MKRLACFSSHQIKRLVPLIALALLVLLLAVTPILAAPLQQGTIHKYYIASVIDTSFTVSWTTELPCTSEVRYGTTPALGTTISDAQNTTTHFVTVGPLSGGTPYYFDIVSGSTVDDNDGAHYTVTTGPTLGLPSSKTLFGGVRQSDGTTAVPYAIVYIKVTHLGVDSELVAVRTASPSGNWSYNFGNLRTADYQSYFPWATGDTITIIGQGGVLGTGQITPAMPSGTGNIGNVILNNIPNAITLRSITTRADSSVWVPVGLALLGTAAIVVVVARKRRS
jgi:hypothetical protein